MTGEDAQGGPAEQAAEPGTRSAPRCAGCGGQTSFAGGESTHDLWAERFVCRACGHETFRSFGRGSVS